VRRRFPWRGDLAVVVVLALLCLIVALVPATDWLRGVALIPMVLALTGYAISAAFFLPGSIPRDERIVLTAAFCVTAAGLGGLALQVPIGLDRPAWAVLLTVIVILAGTVAEIRRQTAAAGNQRRRTRLPRVAPASVAAILAAVALAGWAIASASEGERRQLNDTHFTSLWALPTGSSYPGAIDLARGRAVKFGVSSHEGRTVVYELRVRRGSKTVKVWLLRLRPGQTWEATLATSELSGNGGVVAVLRRGDQVYRRVALKPGGET
jgi:uncharacterized membrane protein